MLTTTRKDAAASIAMGPPHQAAAGRKRHRASARAGTTTCLRDRHGGVRERFTIEGV